MGLLCTCPQSTALGSITQDSCPESIGQIQRLLFQRKFSAAKTLNGFTIATAAPTALASWTALTAANNSTKVTVSPYVSAPNIEPGQAREYGGGNETIGGIPVIVGREPTTFTGSFIQVSQRTVTELKKYQCEDVGVYLVDEYGRIVGLTDSHATPTVFRPIPLASLFIGDKMLGQLENVDKNDITFRFFPNWSDMLHIVTPADFNALTDLA